MEPNTPNKTSDTQAPQSAPSSNIQPTPEQGNPQKPEINLPRIRTFSADIQSAVSNQNVSKINIVTSEQNKRRSRGEEIGKEPEERKHIGLTLGYILATLLFLAGGFGIFMFFQSQNQLINNSQVEPIISNKIINVSEVKTIAIDDNDALPQVKEKLLSSLNSFLGNKNNFVEIDPIIISTNEEGEREDTQMTLDGLFLRLAISDSGFARLSSEYIYGVYKGSEPFMLIEVTDPDEAFGRLFGWEGRMLNDLKSFFPSLEYESTKTEIEREEDVEEITEETANEMEEEIVGGEIEEQEPEEMPEPEYLEEIIFNPADTELEDQVFYNLNTRSAYDKKEKLRFYYTFIRPNLVLFGNNPEMIKDMLEEFKNRSLKR